MKEIWNNQCLKKHCERIKDWALQDKRFDFTEDELGSPYLDKLSHQTKSYRIHRMISLAYILGEMRGIEEADEGLTPIKPMLEKIEPINK